jgi:hypothetical protein
MGSRSGAGTRYVRSYGSGWEEQGREVLEGEGEAGMDREKRGREARRRRRTREGRERRETRMEWAPALQLTSLFLRRPRAHVYPFLPFHPYLLL